MRCVWQNGRLGIQSPWEFPVVSVKVLDKEFGNCTCYFLHRQQLGKLIASAWWHLDACNLAASQIHQCGLAEFCAVGDFKWVCNGCYCRTSAVQREAHIGFTLCVHFITDLTRCEEGQRHLCYLHRFFPSWPKWTLISREVSWRGQSVRKADAASLLLLIVYSSAVVDKCPLYFPSMRLCLLLSLHPMWKSSLKGNMGDWGPRQWTHFTGVWQLQGT